MLSNASHANFNIKINNNKWINQYNKTENSFYKMKIAIGFKFIFNCNLKMKKKKTVLNGSQKMPRLESGHSPTVLNRGSWEKKNYLTH